MSVPGTAGSASDPGCHGGTVYFLGAGFAKAYGGPSQAQIWPWICGEGYDVTGGLSQIRQHLCPFGTARARVQEFIAQLFGTDAKPPLEHVFTSLDLAIARDQYLRDISPAGLRDIREKLVACIALLFRAVREKTLEHVVPRFRCAIEGRPRILTTNWDLLVERDLRPDGLPDYGFPIGHYRFRPGAVDELELITSPDGPLLALVLKLHGSLNWLFCRDCGQIMAVISEAAHHEYLERPACPRCRREVGGDTGPLVSQIITPTFLKHLAPPHFQQTWSRAAQELREADRVVFVGYSLPLADYEIATLLARNMRPTAKVRVVLCDCERDRTDTADNYRRLFGRSRCRFNFGGVAGWLAHPCEFPEE